MPDVEANKDLAEGEEPKMKTVPNTVESYVTMNTQKPIWLRPPNDVTDEEYKEYEKRMKDDRKLNDFLGEDDGNGTEFIPSKTSRPDLNDCSDSETSSDAEEGNFDSKK